MVRRLIYGLGGVRGAGSLPPPPVSTMMRAVGPLSPGPWSDIAQECAWQAREDKPAEHGFAERQGNFKSGHYRMVGNGDPINCSARRHQVGFRDFLGRNECRRRLLRPLHQAGCRRKISQTRARRSLPTVCSAEWDARLRYTQRLCLRSFESPRGRRRGSGRIRG